MNLNFKNTISIFLCFQMVFLPALSVLGDTETAESDLSKSAVRIAVLPFDNISGKANLEYLGPSVADSLSTKLVSRKELALVERRKLELAMEELKLQSSGMVQERDILKLGNFLGAENIIYGTITQFGTLLSINCRIMDVKKGTVVFGTAVSTHREDKMPDLIDELAEKIVIFLSPKANQHSKQLQLRNMPKKLRRKL